MQALHSFTIRPRLPDALTPLRDLATNLRWTWDERTRDLFRSIDPTTWDAAGRDPLHLLTTASPERLDELAADEAFLSTLTDVSRDLQRYLEEPRWFQRRGGSPVRSIAYFSPEFGISESLPQYSGGLGILAGDHLKAASDLALPLVGVGLLYRHGYFRQFLDSEGWQGERYPELDSVELGLTPVDGADVFVDLAGVQVGIRVLRVDVGRVPLYFLDTDIESNDPDARIVTDRLYGGDKEHRIRQEIVLGIGGVRALAAAGVDTQVFHTNEGHAGFLGLERIRLLVTESGLTFAEALEVTRAGSIFTTHTPVPAGIDRFGVELVEKYLGSMADECGITVEELLELGHEPEDATDSVFNMAVMGFRLAGRSNGVSKLHGVVSRDAFVEVWPELDAEEVPITSITNGVHPRTWTSRDMEDLLSRHVGPGWPEAGVDAWSRVLDVPDKELWVARESGRARLVSDVRRRLRTTLEATGQVGKAPAWCDDVLDPEVLTICWARRFATYKRATLLLTQPERLAALLTDPDRPIQLVMAGKAHPADDLGKALISELVRFSSDPTLRHRIVFIEDYDMRLARTLTQGADVWLNTPRRPLEACGTSGMKAAFNGVLNCSILDGWWDELYDGTNGWGIESADHLADDDTRDRLEAEHLFTLLEGTVIPSFYDRRTGRSGVPQGWIATVKRSLASLGPQVTAARMVRDYLTELYEAAAVHLDDLVDADFARGRGLASWKVATREAWPKVSVRVVSGDGEPGALGDLRVVEAVVDPGSLAPSDLAVELLHGPVDVAGHLDHYQVVPMTHLGATDGGLRYQGSLSASESGRYGFTVRVLPHHVDLAIPTELGLVARPD